MRKARLLILGFILFGANQFSSLGLYRAQSPASKPKSDELVLVGTVTKLYPVAGPRVRRRWAVVTHVDRVVSGRFSGTTFTFTIHSPARAGLRVNRAYIIKATRTDSGYVVNELALEEVRSPGQPSSQKFAKPKLVGPWRPGSEDYDKFNFHIDASHLNCRQCFDRTAAWRRPPRLYLLWPKASASRFSS